MDCSAPGSFVHGTSQARILEWVAIFFSRGSSQPKDRTYISPVSCLVGWFFTAELFYWAPIVCLALLGTAPASDSGWISTLEGLGGTDRFTGKQSNRALWGSSHLMLWGGHCAFLGQGTCPVKHRTGNPNPRSSSFKVLGCKNDHLINFSSIMG